MMDFLADLKDTVALALREDLGDGDITASLINAGQMSQAQVICRQQAVICGRPWVDEVFRQVNPAISVDWQLDDGDQVAENFPILTAAGPAQSLVSAERTALNFLQMLSGTATCTRHFAELLTGTGVTLLDTRKTLPGLRLAQKYAVFKGGGTNHRAGLYDAYLIKENHIKAAGGIAKAVRLAKQDPSGRRVEVEVENLGQLAEALGADPDWIMLDNFSLADMAEACRQAKGTGIKIEASGGIDEAALLDIAATGVDFISLGALTKHVQAIDLSMLFIDREQQ